MILFQSDGRLDGDVLLCRELDPSITKNSPVIRVAKQIANGLHEVKQCSITYPIIELNINWCFGGKTIFILFVRLFAVYSE